MDPRFSQIPTLVVDTAIAHPTNVGAQLVMQGSIEGVPPTTSADVFGLNCLLQRRDATGAYLNTGSVAVPAWTAVGSGGGSLTGGKNEIVYFDGSNNPTSDDNFTRQADGQTAFESTFGTDIVSYQMSSDIFGLGVKGIGTKVADVSGNFVADFVAAYGGSVQKATLASFVDTSATTVTQSKNLYKIEVKGTTTDTGELITATDEVAHTTTSGSNRYGFQKIGNATRMGKVAGSGGTYIEHDVITGISKILGVPEYADDAAAVTGGLVSGQIYKTTGGGSSVLKIVA